jgi:hypothetical protein
MYLKERAYYPHALGPKPFFFNSSLKLIPARACQRPACQNLSLFSLSSSLFLTHSHSLSLSLSLSLKIMSLEECVCVCICIHPYSFYAQVMRARAQTHTRTHTRTVDIFTINRNMVRQKGNPNQIKVLGERLLNIEYTE